MFFHSIIDHPCHKGARHLFRTPSCITHLRPGGSRVAFVVGPRGQAEKYGSHDMIFASAVDCRPAALAKVAGLGEVFVGTPPSKTDSWWVVLLKTETGHLLTSGPDITGKS